MNILLLTQPTIAPSIPEFPPVWPAYLAGAVRRQFPDTLIRFVDSAFVSGRIEDILYRSAADAVVIWCSHDTRDTMHALRPLANRYRFVFAGDYATDELLNMFPEAVIVAGETETCIPKLLEAIRDSRDLSRVRGIVFRGGGEIVRTEAECEMENLDNLPEPDVTLFNFSTSDIAFYKGLPETRQVVGALLTSRGKRIMSSRRVLFEISELYDRLHVRVLVFLDQNFMIDRSRVIQICRELIQRNWGLKWKCRAESEDIDEELLQLMSSAGCYLIQYPRVTGRVIEKTHASRILVQCASGSAEHIYGSERSEEIIRNKINKLVKLGVQKIIIHGTAEAGRAASRFAEDAGMTVVAFSDNAEPRALFDKPVIRPEMIPSMALDAVLITSKTYQDLIYEQLSHLKRLGIIVMKGYDPQTVHLEDGIPAFDQFNIYNRDVFTPADNLSLLLTCLPKNFSDMSVFDCGCGLYRGGNVLLRDLPFRKVFGIDIYQPYIDVVSREVFPHWKETRFEQFDALKAIEKFGARSFDIALQFDVLEHMSREAGEHLISELEKMARVRVIHWMPQGKWEQELDEHGLDAWGYDNKYQCHQSAWDIEDFLSRGYKVFKVEGEQSHSDASRAYSKIWAFKDV